MLVPMERFYFDLYNSEGPEMDRDGQLFPTRERARIEALRILHDVAHDEMLDGDLIKITVKVRDENRKQIFEASLTLASTWS
jgi:uncharacterized protein DUF6894